MSDGHPLYGSPLPRPMRVAFVVAPNMTSFVRMVSMSAMCGDARRNVAAVVRRSVTMHSSTQAARSTSTHRVEFDQEVTHLGN